MGNKQYDLRDPKDIRRLNNLLNDAGIHFEQNLYDPYVWINTERFRIFSKRKAGRRTIITTKRRHRVFTLRSQKKPIREIAAATGISTATVRKILKDYEAPDTGNQMTLDV